MGSLRLSAAGGFPLLVKFLDASENLSVQVHPSPAYAQAHPGAHLKTESWYIVDAEPGAVIYKGVKAGVTREAFAAHVRDNTVMNDMIAIQVKAGDFHHLPSGTCHALGAGVVVAEVQTPSDTTYRVYDWGRTGRKLHLDEALACIAYEPSAPRFAVAADTRAGERELVETEFYTLRELRTPGDAPADAEHALWLPSGAGAPTVWMCIAGQGRIESVEDGFAPAGFKAGDTILIPAGLGAARAFGSSGTIILEARLPAGASPA
jgi:mannose-6-phosphate isomerase